MSKRLSRKALDQRNMALVGMGYPIEEPRQVSRLLRKERVQTGAQEKPPSGGHFRKTHGRPSFAGFTAIGSRPT
jgi:hypothetical protein